MKKWKPIIIKNNIIPICLSKIAPIRINAFSFGCFVFCRRKMVSKRKKRMRLRLWRHETTHFQQQLELLFVFQWILYGFFYLYGLIKYRNSKKAYYRIPFEQEAYDNQHDPSYLPSRKRYSWWKYKI